VGYSTGCFIVSEATKRVRPSVRIGEVVLLAGAVSPTYDIGELAGRVGRVHVFHSRLDTVISGLGPVLFGSNDGRWAPACGMLGLPSSPAVVSHYAWSPSAMAYENRGDHFSITSSAFVASRVAPLLVAGARVLNSGRGPSRAGFQRLPVKLWANRA
jgi:hypothetical protein